MAAAGDLESVSYGQLSQPQLISPPHNPHHRHHALRQQPRSAPPRRRPRPRHVRPRPRGRPGRAPGRPVQASSPARAPRRVRGGGRAGWVAGIQDQGIDLSTIFRGIFIIFEENNLVDSQSLCLNAIFDFIIVASQNIVDTFAKFH